MLLDRKVPVVYKVVISTHIAVQIWSAVTLLIYAFQKPDALLKITHWEYAEPITSLTLVNMTVLCFVLLTHRIHIGEQHHDSRDERR